MLSMDSYTATEAGRILGISARRIRQLADAKSLKIVKENPLRVSAVDVLDMKKKREAKGLKATTLKSSLESELLRQSLETLSQAVELMQKQLTSGEEAFKRNEDNLRAQLMEEKATRERLERELSELRNRRRGFFSR
jgi:NADH dehydrogenase/NADH:ubiquinone oxidoreductase subunit G